MKKMYVVSHLSTVNPPNADDVFYHSHIIALENGVSLDGTSVADFNDDGKEKIQENWDETEVRYLRYRKILARRLNQIHGANFSNEFWYRLFSLGLLRNVAMLYDFFLHAERNFNSKNHKVMVLDQKDFFDVQDFEQQGDVLGGSWIGQEQLLAIYLQVFYPEVYFNSERIQLDEKIEAQKKSITQLVSEKWRRTLQNVKRPREGFLALMRRYHQFSSKLPFLRKSIKLVVMGSYFSPDAVAELQKLLGKKISFMSPPRILATENKDTQGRRALSAEITDSDRFDKFFFACCESLIPRTVLEDFEPNVEFVRSALNKIPKVEFIASEAWLSSTAVNLFRAVAFEERAVGTLYTEHNCLFHPYDPKFVTLIASLVDEYLTMGWKSTDENFFSLSSLFKFKLEIKRGVVKFPILYVSYPIFQIKPIFSPIYAVSGQAAVRHLGFVEEFFLSLPNPVTRKIFYRGYPKDYSRSSLRYDKEELLKDCLKEVTQVAAVKTTGETCKEQMASAGIVIVDFLSTAYLESLMMNVPTICFWDPESYYLSDKYPAFLDDLIEAKIIHTSVSSVVSHLLEIVDNPESWWMKSEIQRLKNRWLTRNFGEASQLISYLESKVEVSG